MTFADQFALSRGEPIQIDGQTVHAIFRLHVDRNLELRVRWQHVANEPSQGIAVQGLKVKTKGGALRVGESIGTSIVLWTDTAPREVLLRCEGHVREISIWNCWRTLDGTEHAWLNNGGMLIEERDNDVIRFRCNSRMEITFEDLSFELERKEIE